MIAAQLSAEHQSGHIVNYQLSADDVKSAWKTVQRSIAAYILGPALGLLAIGLLIPALLPAVLIFLAFGCILSLSSPRKLGRAFLQAKGIQPDESLKVRLNFTSNALLSEDKAIITQQAWHRFGMFLESDDWFIILTGKGEFVSIPRHQVEPEALSQIRQHLVTAGVKQRASISWPKLALVSIGAPAVMAGFALSLGALRQATTQGDLNQLTRFCDQDEIGVVTETADGGFSFYCS